MTTQQKRLAIAAAALVLGAIMFKRLGAHKLLNLRLMIATGYLGSFGHGEFGAWLAQQPQTVRDAANAVTAANGASA